MEEDEEDSVFYGNPYFDEIMIFLIRVPTSQDKFKTFKCSKCEEPLLYKGYSKKNKTDFVEVINSALKKNPNPEWPFLSNLSIQFSVSDTPSRISQVDLDNLAKTLVDALKGTVFKDDNQIIALSGTKEVVNNIKGCFVNVRKLEQNERPVFQQYFISSSNEDPWLVERNQKAQQDRQTRFESYIEDETFLKCK